LAEDEAKQEEAPPATDPVRRVTLWVLGLALFLFVWYLAADRYTPYTHQARVRGYVVPLAPQVSGVLTEVAVGINQLVEKGDVLARIDQRSYELAVRAAEAELEQAGQNIGAGTEGIAASQARVTEAKTRLAYDIRDAERTFELERHGVAPKRDADRSRTRIERSRAEVERAEAELQQAKAELGDDGVENPRIQAAITALEQTRLDLARATLRAPTDGVVLNAKLDVGHYAQAGQRLMTFVSTTDVWIEAFLRENSLGNVNPGDRVELALDVAPGRVFAGFVSSVGHGVQWDRTEPGGLPQVPGARGWLRDPQRFPVVIRFADDTARGLRREGGQAEVIIYTSGNWVLNGIGWLWIRLASLLSYGY
jgi:multidrug resistance efflux pump